MAVFCYTASMFTQNQNYKRSNKITTVNFKPTAEAKFLVDKLMDATDFKSRERLSTLLLDSLSRSVDIELVAVKISDTNQYHKKSNGRVSFKQYGYYRPKTGYIYIQNRTAVRGQILAAKSFVDTLLHEWVHHYDTHVLSLDSIHTKGFYMRLKDLRMKLGV